MPSQKKKERKKHSILGTNDDSSKENFFLFHPLVWMPQGELETQEWKIREREFNFNADRKKMEVEEQ